MSVTTANQRRQLKTTFNLKCFFFFAFVHSICVFFITCIDFVITGSFCVTICLVSRVYHRSLCLRGVRYLCPCCTCTVCKCFLTGVYKKCAPTPSLRPGAVASLAHARIGTQQFTLIHHSNSQLPIADTFATSVQFKV